MTKRNVTNLRKKSYNSFPKSKCLSVTFEKFVQSLIEPSHDPSNFPKHDTERIPISMRAHLCKHYLKSNETIFIKTTLDTCLCVLSKLAILTTDSAEPMVLLIIHVIFVPNVNYNMWIKDLIDGTIIPLYCCSNSRKSLLQLTVSSQPKVTIIKYDNIDFILTIGFETKLLFDGTTISLLLTLLLIVNVFASVHESLL